MVSNDDLFKKNIFEILKDNSIYQLHMRYKLDLDKINKWISKSYFKFLHDEICLSNEEKNILIQHYWCNSDERKSIINYRLINNLDEK